jgi:transcriptional regulator with XRE-family HTH domain
MSTKNRERFPEIGERLKKERQRLCLSQEAFCKLFGVKDPKTLRSWEAGTTAPTLFDLAEFGARGGDVVFIITGHPQPYLTGSDDLRAAYLTPALRVAGDIAGMTLASEDADLLLAMARRLDNPK